MLDDAIEKFVLAREIRIADHHGRFTDGRATVLDDLAQVVVVDGGLPRFVGKIARLRNEPC